MVFDPNVIGLLKDFGFPVLTSAALGWFIVRIMREHREERAVDREERREISKEHANATRELADAVVELKIHLEGNRL